MNVVFAENKGQRNS